MNDRMPVDTIIVEVEGRTDVIQHIDKYAVIARLRTHIESLKDTKRKADAWLDHDAEYNRDRISSAANIPSHLLNISDIKSVMDTLKSDSEDCEKLIDFYEYAISKIIDESIKVYSNESDID